jgi:hypothetical protein
VTEPEQPPTSYPNVAAFVEQYLVNVYQRQVTDTTDAVWCPEWWKHTEAVARLEVVWRAWEHFRRNDRTGLSTWFLDHADKHMAKLLDPSGPFKYCSVRHGHREMLAPLPLTSPPAGMFAAPSVETPNRMVYGSLVQFVENYLSLLYRRQVTDTTDTVWCRAWWMHQEAVIRLNALWRAWEHYRRYPGTGLSTWFIEHADLQMAVLFDPRGPFRYCSARQGHKDLLGPLTVEPVIPEMWSELENKDDYRIDPDVSEPSSIYE